MNQSAFITGASRGIGRAIARELAAQGYDLYLVCKNNPALLLDLQDELTQHYPVSITCFTGDVASPSFIKECFSKIGHLDVLVNNAGISYVGLLTDMSEKDWDNVLSTNLSSAFYTARQAIPLMLKEHSGQIINISSVTAIGSNPHGVAYGATKAGLLSFSRSLFDEVRKYGVRVTAILPDMTDTQLYRHADFEADPAMDAHLEAEDVADAVEYALTTRAGSCVPEIILRPQLHRIKKK